MNIKAKGFKKLVSLALFGAMLVQGIPAVSATVGTTDKTQNALEEMKELMTSINYEEYMDLQEAENPDAKMVTTPVTVAAADYNKELSSDDILVLKDTKGILAAKDRKDRNGGKGYLDGIDEYLLTRDESKAVWDIDIPETGYYNIKLTYFPYVNLYYDLDGENTATIAAAPTDVETFAGASKYVAFEHATDADKSIYTHGNTASIERILKINKSVPFSEARTFTFSRIWKDKIEEGEEPDQYGRAFKKDISGNEIRSKKYEDPEWFEKTLSDSNAFYSESFKFYFEKGANTLHLESSRENCIIAKIELFAEEKLPTYAEVLAGYEKKGYKSAASGVTLQAELPDATSEQVIYPVNDKTSAITQPQSPEKTLVNTIGGDKWEIAGQWIRYTFNCEESGLYYIVPRARQSVYAGIFASRSLKINGEYPFEEAKYLQFNYSDDWKTDPLNNNAENFKFYFEKGKSYELEFECVLGALSDKLRQVDESLVRMNDYYRSILMITGPTPSSYTDYGFTKLIPDVLRSMRKESEKLYEISAELEAIIGEKGEHSVLLDKVAYTLDIMGKNENKIADNLDILKSYIGSIGTWLLQSRNQPLQMDYISIQGVDEKLPQGEASGFQSIGFEISSFIMSFFTDYNSYGAMQEFDKDTEGEIVEVWLTTGRDQATIMREMVDDFTEETGIAVNYKLVAAGTLLPATLAGIGPDVSTDADATGFGVRTAVRNLAERDTETGEYIFKGFDEVRGIGDYKGKGWFSDEAWTGLTVFNPDATDPMNKEAVYGVPVTQSFSMLFYRKDIFVELGLEVPETWDDVYDIIKKLADKNMTMGFSQGQTQILMYQQNIPYYRGDAIESIGYATNLDCNEALDAFREMCRLFTDYSQPVAYDFANRFRTGEMPIGIQDYSLCNQLLCFAPEIKGLWEFVRLPGVEAYDGSVNHNTPTAVSAIMIMSAAKNPENAWEYIKWWVGAEAQERFGKEQVALLGTAAKYTTANKEALFGQPWSAQELRNLSQQFESLKGTPMTPGNYIIARYTNFAFLDVYDGGESPADAMLYYIDEINKEITRKRDEYDFYVVGKQLDSDGNIIEQQ